MTIDYYSKLFPLYERVYKFVMTEILTTSFNDHLTIRFGQEVILDQQVCLFASFLFLGTLIFQLYLLLSIDGDPSLSCSSSWLFDFDDQAQLFFFSRFFRLYHQAVPLPVPSAQYLLHALGGSTRTGRSLSFGWLFPWNAFYSHFLFFHGIYSLRCFAVPLPLAPRVNFLLIVSFYLLVVVYCVHVLFYYGIVILYFANPLFCFAIACFSERWNLKFIDKVHSSDEVLFVLCSLLLVEVSSSFFFLSFRWIESFLRIEKYRQFHFILNTKNWLALDSNKPMTMQTTCSSSMTSLLSLSLFHDSFKTT